MELLSSIEHSAFSTWVREGSSIFGYYGFLFLHTVGLSLVVGFSVVIDLRLLGFVRRLPVAPLEQYFPVIWLGFWINAASGAVLLISDATAKLTSPMFGLKMLLVALAVADLILIRRLVFRELTADGVVPPIGRILAAASIALWCGAIAAGRVMAFIETVPGGQG